MAITNYTIHIDQELRDRAFAVLEHYGLPPAQAFKLFKLPSKLSFLRNFFIPALTPTPLPPGEGLFRIKALASVSCKIVVWKEVFSKTNCRHPNRAAVL